MRRDAATGVVPGLQNRSAGEESAGGFDSHIPPPPRAALPAVHAVLGDPAVAAACAGLAEPYRTRLVRGVLAEHRRALDPAAAADPAALRARVVADCVREAGVLARPWPRRVINATGVLLHTNLGRAPLGGLAPSAADAAVAGGYCELEWDAETQRRGDRDAHIQRQLRLLTGAASALAVNNCASALFLALGTLGAGREVLVSRAELVEIGGGFRIPEVIEASGCRLREVGTTNRTRLADFERHARPGAAVLLKVHPSNFVQRGFVAGVGTAELAALGRRLGVPVVEDCGSGLLDPAGGALRDEPTVSGSLRAGADVVCWSGDKLFGGVQAGLLAGRSAPLAAMRRHPLYRVLRLDKVRMGLLAAVLREHLAGAGGDLPLWRLFHAEPETLRARAACLRLPVPPTRWARCAPVPLRATLGGGSSPDSSVESLGLELVHRELSVNEVRSRLAARPVPIVGYVRRDRLYLDLRACFPEDYPEIQHALDDLS
jgi:L-seryl-tRNA(Ser) seleniumtransferase